MPEWLKALVRSDLAKILRNIGESVIIACAILWGLTLVHGLLLRSTVSDGFRQAFISFHELVTFFTYVWVSITSLGELVLRSFNR